MIRFGILALIALAAIILGGCSKKGQPIGGLSVQVRPPKTWYSSEHYLAKYPEHFDARLFHLLVDDGSSPQEGDYFVKVFFYITENDPDYVDRNWNAALRCVGYFLPGSFRVDPKWRLKNPNNKWVSNDNSENDSLRKCRIGGELFYGYEYKGIIYEQKGMVYEGLVNGVLVVIDYKVHKSDDIEKMEDIIRTIRFK